MIYYRPVPDIFCRLPVLSFAQVLRFRLIAFICLCCLQHIPAQDKRMVAIGSSTTAGYITTSSDSSWFGRFATYYKCRLNVMDSSYNLGVPGAGVYSGMPATSTPPTGRPNPDIYNGVSRAVYMLKPLANPANGVIIVNYPSNYYDTYSIAEIMAALQLIYDSATQAGNRCFITTTQPRSDAAYSSSVIKRKLADIKDSTINRFGDAHTLNFWDGLYNPADSSILSIYSAGDQVHFNNAGHRVLFERILAKNVFGLPAWYATASGFLNLLTSWGSNPDGSGTHPTSFTADYQVFTVANNLNPTVNGDWTLSGRNVQLIIGDGIRPVVFNVPAQYLVSLSAPPLVSGCN